MFNAYQEWTRQMMIPRVKEEMSREEQIIYAALGLAGESGEAVEKIKKGIRDDVFDLDGFILELGDVLFYLARLADLHKVTLEDVMERNMVKIISRRARDVQSGEGDKR